MISLNEKNSFAKLIANTTYTLLTPQNGAFMCDNFHIKAWFLDIEFSNTCFYVEDLLASKELSEDSRLQLHQFLNIKRSTAATNAFLTELNNGRMLRWLWLDSILMVEDVTDYFTELHRLLVASHFDSLTGLANRRQFNLDFERLYTQNLRSGQTGALILFDLNGFKEVNDQFGHAAGDRVLAEFGKLAKPIVRPYECLARIGGDEFAVITAHSGNVGAIRIQTAMSKALAKLAPIIGLDITASFGVALFGKSQNASKNKYETDFTKQLELIFAQADANLYSSKALSKS